MFERERIYFQAKRRNADEGRRSIGVDKSKLWRPDEACGEGIGIPSRCVFAQNDSYLEVCNPGLERNWLALFFFLVLMAAVVFFVWSWYGFAVQPLFTGTVSALWMDWGPADRLSSLFGWLFIFPSALLMVCIAYALYRTKGITSMLFTYTRGRIRFNRVTRKVYVLRPPNCGGNAVFEWSSLRAILDSAPYELITKRRASVLGVPYLLVLYWAGKAGAESDDAIFVGPNVSIGRERINRFWEYIRRYMEQGPTVDRIPLNAPTDYAEVPHYLPQNYFTFCGRLSDSQYRLEEKHGLYEGIFFQLSQLTCRWPRFPKEWASDSGVGEPEDRPVQAGAVMTAMVYRAQGKLSKADEIEFLTHWGTPEALAEAKAQATASTSTESTHV